MTNHLKTLLALLFMGTLIACDNSNSETEQVATRWAQAFFNYNFQEAQQYVTPESEQWLRFAASNVTQQDIDALNNNEGATVSIDGYYPGTDSTGIVYLNVENYLQMDSIGKVGTRRQHGSFQMMLVKRDGKWKVRMEGLPRNERQSRD
jgi:hypothetical protein